MKKIILVLLTGLLAISCVTTGKVDTVPAEETAAAPAPAAKTFPVGEAVPSAPGNWANLGMVQITDKEEGISLYGEGNVWGGDVIYQGRVRPEDFQLEIKTVMMNGKEDEPYPALDNSRMLIGLSQRGEIGPDMQGMLLQVVRVGKGLVMEAYTGMGDFMNFGYGLDPIVPVESEDGTYYINIHRNDSHWFMQLSSPTDPGRENVIPVEDLPVETFRNGTSGLGLGIQSAGPMEVDVIVRTR